MIISASRRTDITAFYTEWFMNRVRAGFCTVPNPFNPNQISNVSLAPENVDLFVFWTRNPKPLIPHLKELNVRGYSYYFLFTLMDNPQILDPKSPPPGISIDTFRKLSDLIGPEKIIWRYDPIVLSNVTGIEFHKQQFEFIAEKLRGHTFRCIISFVDIYRKMEGRLKKLGEKDFVLQKCDDYNLYDLLIPLVRIADNNGIEIRSCASKKNLTGFGIPAGKCIDDIYISKIFGKHLDLKKDPYQRKNCNCVSSKDIGMYDSRLYECLYCYATTSFDRAKINHKKYDPDSPSLLG
ncbi:MAG: DUF1848 domain-containing protein [Proteobacteria bacterium]|nr:DUF1848 domain-containing protein [Pseudomonadota bacterium]MBU1569434.1 DUF1848 domain-containing protein [Pseudomonadota bacterium]